jgi:hypothetical protein
LSRRVQPAPWWAIALFVGVGMTAQIVSVFADLGAHHAVALRGAGSIIVGIGAFLFVVRIFRKA